jgi:RNA polymerase sigma-70 factor, ECF subfamily
MTQPGKIAEVTNLPDVEQMDRGLLEAHKRGDPGALEAIVRLHGAGILGYLRKMCGSTDQAEDMFQETFKKVYESARTIRGDKLRPWLYAVATNVAMDGLRKKKRLRFVSFGGDQDRSQAEAVADDKADPPADAMREELRGIVKTEVAALPERMRATLILAYYEGLSYAEIAECMGCSIGTVKTQMFRAMKTLAERLPEAAGETE